MRRAIICFCVALTVGVPAICHAQYYDNDRQNPKQYTNDESQPVRLMAYVLSPFGFALKWGVTEPLHYIATDTFLAPVLGGNQKPEPYVPPFPPLEPEAGSPPPQPAVASAPAPAEVRPGAPTSAAPNLPEAAKPAAPHAPPVSAPSPAQPIMH